MKGVKRVARGTILVVVTLWFALSFGTVWATENVNPDMAGKTSQAVVAEEGHAKDAATVVHQEAKTSGHEAAEHGEEHPAITKAKLMDLGFRFMNFAVLVFILVYYGAKPIAAGLSSRKNKIKNDIEDLEAKKAEAEKSFKEFETKLAGIEAEIDTIVEKAVAQAEIEKARIIEKAEQAAADIQRQAEMAIQHEIMEAKRTLKNDIADQAAAMAEELIKKNLTAADQVKIVEDYLVKVGAVQ
jgi:F-type H+-transporting ATPase subunit b